MRKNRGLKKFAALMVAGSTMFQFGGCGDFFGLSGRNIPVGFGQGIGGSIALLVNAALVAPFVQPFIDDLGGLLGTNQAQ